MVFSMSLNFLLAASSWLLSQACPLSKHDFEGYPEFYGHLSYIELLHKQRWNIKQYLFYSLIFFKVV